MIMSSWFKQKFDEARQAFSPIHQPPVIHATPRQHVIFGGTGRTGEESVGHSQPHPSTLVTSTEVHRVYQTPKEQTLVMPGPGVTGGFLRRTYEKITGWGETGMEANTSHATTFGKSDSTKWQQPHHVTGYSRGAVSGGTYAEQRSQEGLTTHVDLRDPVGGGSSSITPVGVNVHGRQQLSMGNYLPGFGTTLFDGESLSTVITTPELGGHSARARTSFTSDLPQGVPGKVSMYDGRKSWLATKSD